MHTLKRNIYRSVKCCAVFPEVESTCVLFVAHELATTEPEGWGHPRIHAGCCLPGTGSLLASLHSLVWKKPFLSGIYSTITLSGPVNFWTRAVGLCSGWLSHPPTCPHGKWCLQTTKASLLNHESWAQPQLRPPPSGRKTIPPLYEVVHVKSQYQGIHISSSLQA